MINRKDFDEMKKEMQEFDTQRELLIKKSRDVLKLSKQIIYAVHRDDLKDAEALIIKIKAELKTLNNYVENEPKMYFQGSYKVAIQEYVEAMLYYNFVKNNVFLTRKELGVKTNYYLLGVCDISGEVYRKAIHAASKGDYGYAFKVKELLEEIYEVLLGFDIRESELRRKFDSIKYDLQKLEDVCFQLKLKK